MKQNGSCHEPKRIQRKRSKGFNLQKASPNGLPVVYVGRPTRWGNPYKVTSFSLDVKGMDRENAIRLYAQWLDEQLIKDSHFLDALKGKDLACFCPLNLPCHADIILKKLAEMDAFAGVMDGIGKANASFYNDRPKGGVF